ncbi:MAG: EpsG family protein [Candidatus Amulumruptor caecigallinarius]|nr:EpsG family protein [Candidatus Amulumruptor caecigallinarius]
MIYIFLIAVLLFGSVYYNDKRPDKGNIYLIIEYLVIVLIFGLRYKVGGDTCVYFYQYDEWPTLDEFQRIGYESERFNIGWVLLSGISKLIYNDFATLQILQSAIVNAAFFYFFKKHVPNYFTAILFYGLMYMLTFNTELMRASLAISVFLFGFDFYLKRKWVQYYLLAIVAFLFHNEAVMMMALPVCVLLSKIKTNLFNLTILLLICVVSVLIFDVTPYLLSVLSVSERVLSTLENYTEMTNQANVNGFIAQTFYMMPWFLFLWLSKNHRNLYWRGFIILFIFFSYQQLRYLEVMVRACDFLYPFTIVAMCYGCRVLKRNVDFLMKSAIVVCLCIAISVRLYGFIANEHWKLFYPYSSVFSPQENSERESLVDEFQQID